MPTYAEKRLLEWVQKARDEKKKAEEVLFSEVESNRVETIVGIWCGNVWWGIGAFGWRDRRLQEEYETSGKANEIKYVSIYGCTFNNNGGTWCGRKSPL